MKGSIPEEAHMAYFGKFYLDKEKDIIVELDLTDEVMSYVLRTPNHRTGNLITNLAKLCGLPLTFDEQGLKVIRGTVPCYVDDLNREVFVLRLGDTKVANIYPDGDIERKAAIPAISKTLMSQTKDYGLDMRKTLVKTYILRECKFRTDLHTHMNANLDPDILIALGIHHQIRYPLYYIKKLQLRCSTEQTERLRADRAMAAKRFASSDLTGKYLTRKIDDNTFINFADLILNNKENASYNIPRIRASLSILKDGQAVFTNLEKVYLYRYVFTKGIPSDEKIPLTGYDSVPDSDIADALRQMDRDRKNPAYADHTLFQDKLLWIARGMRKRGILYAEISDTTLVKPVQAASMLRLVHEAMPAITAETGVTIRFLAAIRRIPLTIVRDQISLQGDFREQLRVLKAVAADPYVSGSDIIGEEMNDIRDLRTVLAELVKIAGKNPGFVLRIHAGENDSLPDNVANSLRCVREALQDGQKMPDLRIGHGLYTANLRSAKGQKLIRDLRENGVVLEFQITSNVRLNNLSVLTRHPLREYLRGGIDCVQGTDGGAIYGTDSIDEQLALERLLELSKDELLAMRQAEDKVLAKSLRVFAEKKSAFEAVSAGRTVEEYLSERISAAREDDQTLYAGREKTESAVCLAPQIREMPSDKVPVVVLGGSFNSDHHTTRMREPLRELIRKLAEKTDPDRVFFVVGHRLTAYEKELVRQAGGRFEVFAIVPTRITPSEAERLKRSGAGIRISIEPSGMGLYKSFAYEIFKRRPSVVIALDGNSAGANTIQEAKNGKKKARIFVCSHARILRAKAQTLQGYVREFDGSEVSGDIFEAVSSVMKEMGIGEVSAQ